MQMTIFEVPKTDVLPFEINDNVRVALPDYKDAETDYYLSIFEKKRGKIIRVVHEPLLQYHVDFDGRIAIVYHSELRYW